MKFDIPRLSDTGIGYLAAIAIMFLPMTLNYEGVCLFKGRLLSEKERIELTIAAINNNKEVSFREKGVGMQYYKRIKYPDLKSFFEQNPNCCDAGKHVAGDVPPPTFLDRILGNYAGLVRVEYIAHYVDKNGNPAEHFVKTVSSIPNCGIYPN